MFPIFPRWRPALWPGNLTSQQHVYHPGIPGLPEQGTLDQRWRRAWPSLTFEPDRRCPDGYYVYFYSENVCKRTIRLVHMPECNVRIGPKPVWFCAVEAKTAQVLNISWVSERLAARI